MKGTWRHQVQFGDCDPAGIVFYPNYYRWFDAATHTMMAAHGHTHASTRERYGLIGWPLIDTRATFKKPAKTGDLLVIRSHVEVQSARVFRIVHQVTRANEIVADGFELRFFGLAEPVLKAVPIPADVLTLFAKPPETPDPAPLAARVVLLDSIGHLNQLGTLAPDSVIVSGSHGGVSAATFVLEHDTKPQAVFFNDAGGGKENAGIRGLALLEQAGIAAACYKHTSARIGEAADALAQGQISYTNRLAELLGCRLGESVGATVELLVKDRA